MSTLIPMIFVLGFWCILLCIETEHPTKGTQTYTLKPLLDNQEFYGNRADNAYWEGACEVLDTQGQVIGKAYLELAGYGGGLGARLN